ncbi:hypothetical protein FQZ97_662310 [compost metagenome]
MVSTPPLLVKVAKVRPPACRLLPLTVNEAPAVLNPKVSAETAVPGCCTVRLAPVQLPLPPLSRPSSASASTAAALESSTTVLPTPAQATLSPLRLPMVGAAFGGLVSPVKSSIASPKKSVEVNRTSSTRMPPKFRVVVPDPKVWADPTSTPFK